MDDIFITGVEDKYSRELLENRVMHEGNVIAIIYKDILLLDEIQLKSEDFITQDGRFYYEVAKNIRQKGFNVIDEVTILSECNEVIINGYEKRGGWQQVQDLVDIVNEKNSDIYLDVLNRENIIIKLYDLGIDLLKSVDCDGNEIIPIKLFRKMDSESVLEWYENKMNEFSTGYSKKILEECDLDISDEFLNALEEGEESGVPFDEAGTDINGEQIKCLPYLSNQTSGFLDGTFNMIGGYSSTGKSTIWITIILGLIYRGKKVLIISNEQKSKVFKIQLICWILAKKFKYYKLTKKKLMNGDISEEDKKHLKMAQQFINSEYKGKLKFVAIPDSDVSLAKKKIRQYALTEGYDAFLYDTFKLDLGGKDDSHWISLIKDSREFDTMCKKYNILGLASLQLALNTLGMLFLDASVLSMSKQIKEVLESLLLMRIVYQEELDKENKKFYCRPFKRKLIGDKWTEEEYEPDPTSTYRMIFTDKNRNGDNSSDTGVAMLLKFNGALGIFSEAAFCRPKHMRIV